MINYSDKNFDSIIFDNKKPFSFNKKYHFMIYTQNLNRNIEKSDYCVYVLMNRRKIVYVGMTTNFQMRKNGHSNKKYNSGILIKCDSIYEAIFLEKDLILCLLPKYNLGTAKYSKEKILHLRNINLKRWQYYIENKNKPEQDSEMYLTKNNIIIMKTGLRQDYDCDKYISLLTKRGL